MGKHYHGNCSDDVAVSRLKTKLLIAERRIKSHACLCMDYSDDAPLANWERELIGCRHYPETGED